MLMEIIIAVLLIAITVIFYLSRKELSISDSKKSGLEKQKTTKDKSKTSNNLPQNKQEKKEIDEGDKKICLVNSFRDMKDMKNLRFIDDQTIAFSDDKRLVIGNFPNFADKNFTFYSKTLDADTIADMVFSKENK